MEQNFAIITLYFVITLVLNTGNMDSERRCNPLLNSAPFGLDQYEKNDKFNQSLHKSFISIVVQDHQTGFGRQVTQENKVK